MAKVKFLKDHLDNKANQSVEITDEQANYFERTGVAVKEEKQAYNNKQQKGNYKTK